MKSHQYTLIAMNMLLGAQFAACDAGPPAIMEVPDGTATATPDGTTDVGEATASSGIEVSGGNDTTGEPDTGGDDTTSDDDTVGGEPPDAGDVDEYILGLGHLTAAPPSPAEQIECEGEDCLQDGLKGDYTCDYTYYSITENYDEFVAFAPNSATLWPGSIVEGADASHGLLTTIGLPRAPLTFSVSHPALINSSVGVLPAPSLSSYRDELKAILMGGLNGSTPANFSFELRQVFSEAEMSLALGTSVSWPGGSMVSSMFSVDGAQTKNQVIANFVQQYFTVDMDTPLHPKDFFADSVTIDELSAFMSVDNPPMYVQSLTYGRRAIFSMESSHSVEELQAALDATIQSAVDVEFKVAYQHTKVLNESTMQVFVLGGSGEDGIHAVDGFQGLLEFIKNGAEFSKDSPAAVIGYKLAHLDNYGTRFAYSTDFAEADCSYTPPDKVRVMLDEIYFHANGCDWADVNCEQTYEIWVETPAGKQEIAAKKVPGFIDDEQSVGLGVVKDLVIPDDDGSWLIVGFSADESGLTVQKTKKFVYDGGWVGFGAQGITAKTPKNADEDLDVTLWFELSEL